MSGFVHLMCHSHYSFMRGVSSPDELCRRARERGMDALALTDVNGLYGAVFFWQAAVEEGIRPIIGADVVTDSERATLLAKDSTGYGRLCEILTSRHLAPKFSLKEELARDMDGLVVLSPDMNLLRFLVGNGVRRDVYAALGAMNANGLPTPSPQSVRELKIPPVAVGDVWFADKKDHSVHRLLRAIDLNTTLSRIDPKELAPERLWLTDHAEMARRFPNCYEAVENAYQLSRELIMKEPPWKGLVFPAFEGLDADGAYERLRAKCYAGAMDRYGKITDDVRKRLDYELGVIRQKGFANYFLVVEDVVTRFPITCGRGSAAASIVSYVLKITHVEPLRHNLFFERFLNPGRVDPPDIDVDFPWDERDGVLDYVFAKYGKLGAAMVANHVSLQGRAAVRETAKVFGMPEGEIKRVTGRMRHLWHVTDAAEVIKNHPLFKDLKLEAPWPEIIGLASRLEGIPRNLSVHCGGVVIAPGELTRRSPLELAPKGVNIIHWEKDQAEDGGLVKIDLLGNRSLAVIRDSLKALDNNYGIKMDYRRFNPIDDPDTQALLARGDTIGVFYVESPAMRQLQKKTQKGDFESLVIHSSIIRPAANDYIREYIRRMRGGAYEPLHPLLGEILRETFGIMCYQEDVTRTAMALAGFDAVDGDGLRKILSKKHRTKKLAEYREKFFKGAIERGVEEKTIEAIWDMILSFSGYSFCKPHSASYALVSFKSAWLRSHYPAEFMAAVISNQGGFYSTFAYVSEARRMGIEIMPPDINESEAHYTGAGKRIRIGFMQVKGLTKTAMDTAIAKRIEGGPYTSFRAFLDRTKIAPSDVELLVKAGCFDSIEGMASRPSLLWVAKEYAFRRNTRATKAPSLFDDRVAERPLPSPAAYDENTVLRQEVETLGFLVSRHPLSLYSKFLKPGSWVAAKDLGKWIGRKVTTVGWYVTGKLVETKHGEPMEFYSFEDTTAIYETTFFPEAYRKFCHMIDREKPFLLFGKIEEDFGAVSMTVERVRPADDDKPISSMVA